jgi:hypothetical protein
VKTIFLELLRGVHVVFCAFFVHPFAHKIFDNGCGSCLHKNLRFISAYPPSHSAHRWVKNYLWHWLCSMRVSVPSCRRGMRVSAPSLILDMQYAGFSPELPERYAGFSPEPHFWYAVCGFQSRVSFLICSMRVSVWSGWRGMRVLVPSPILCISLIYFCAMFSGLASLHWHSTLISCMALHIDAHILLTDSWVCFQIKANLVVPVMHIEAWILLIYSCVKF